MSSKRLLALVMLAACNGDDGKGRSDDSGLPVGGPADIDADGILSTEDCNDGDAAVFPGAPEVCNGLDDDCNGSVDDGLAQSFFRDSDGDGFGDESQPAQACAQPAGFVGNADDCDDSNPGVNPEQIEVCDLFEVDEDCNGQANEADPNVSGIPTWYEDHDEDGYGDASLMVESCFDQPGLATLGSDCNDADYDINPGTPEVCDPADKDEDCDGFADVDDPEGPLDQPLYYIDLDDDDDGDDTDPGQYFCGVVPNGYVTDNTDCDDTNDIINLGAPEHCADGIDNDCNGGVDDCGPIADLTLDLADVRLESSESYGYHGSQVEDAGDVNDDGRADFVTGGYYASGGLGKVWIFEGPIAPGTEDPEDIAAATIEGSTSYAGFGIALSTAGDVNNDGYSDLIVGQTYPGKAYVFEGPFSGDASTTSADATWTEEQLSDYAGEAVGGGFDANDDGLSDYLIGAPYGDYSSYYYTGAVYLVYGPGTGSSSLADADAKFGGMTSYGYIGRAVAGLGDLDGDGADEVAFGAPSASSYKGRVYLYSGSGLTGDYDADATADTMFDGTNMYDYLGEMVGPAGDFNDDGYGDLIMTAYGADTSVSESGSIYVVLGPADTGGAVGTVAHAELYGETYGDNVGFAADGTMDLNRDGFTDVLVGAPYVDDPAAGLYYSGAAYLMYGPQTGDVSLADARCQMNGTTSSEYVGQAVSFIGDQDGDESPDALIGAPYGSAYSGNAYIVFGADL